MQVSEAWSGRRSGVERASLTHTHPHTLSPLSSPSTLHFDRDPSTCSKNHVLYYQDRHGFHASLKATHFKNEAIKGPQDLPLSPLILKHLSYLERGIHAICPSSPTLFFANDGEPYQSSYFSYIASKAISFDGVQLKANDLRHMFATLWRDFINSPSTHLLSHTITQLNANAADLMLNSTQAWSASYDDTSRDRAIHTTLSLWPQFQEFVNQAHITHSSTKEWDPLTLPLDELDSPSS